MDNKPLVPTQRGLGYWAGLLSVSLVKSLGRKLAPSNITPVEWAILEVCGRGEANTPTGLSRLIPVDQAAISRQLDKLKAKGLIQRRRSVRDRRSVRVELTQAGRELVVTLTPLVEANNAKHWGGMPEEEQAALINSIQTMLKNAEEA
jgi:DNA-binding MarR family transcriptional regulator